MIATDPKPYNSTIAELTELFPKAPASLQSRAHQLGKQEFAHQVAKLRRVGEVDLVTVCPSEELASLVDDMRAAALVRAA